MKKLLFLLLYVSMMAYCCGPSKHDLETEAKARGISTDSIMAEYQSGNHKEVEAKPVADRGYFTVTDIHGLEDGSTQNLVHYILLSEQMYDNQYVQDQQQSNNPFRIVLTDTSGKYAVGDTLTLVPKLTPI